MMEEGVLQREHRKKKAGPKAEKKKTKHIKHEEMMPKQRNPKAFSYHSVNKVAKSVRRTLDIKEKKHHIPIIDRTPVEPPPIVVAVVGPPKVGKTTLIQSLVKSYTRQKLYTLKGPVTIISGKKKRITLIECNNDINSMIDLAKIADLVLLLIDASFGFEMEIFEFLNICQVHGFPKIMGVLTHLDHFRNNKQLSTTKKKLKHRFWTEVYEGAKLFYLSGIVNAEYQKTEVHNLGRFISVMKFRPLQWRTTHPYILVDRMEDVTDPETVRLHPKHDRTVCLYGYVRGTHLKEKSYIAIPGCGDFQISDISLIKDPCPLPDTENRRSLNQKERLIYSPFSGVGGIVFDKDAVYIDLGGSHLMKENEKMVDEPANTFVSNIMGTKTTVDKKIENSTLKIFTDTQPVHVEDLKNLNNSELNTNPNISKTCPPIFNDSEESVNDDCDDYFPEDFSANENKKYTHYEDGEYIDDYSRVSNSQRWKENISARAKETFLKRLRYTTNLNKIVYGTIDKGESSEKLIKIENEIGGLFISKKIKTSLKLQSEDVDGMDCTSIKKEILKKWTSYEVSQSIVDCFVTGIWETEKDAKTVLQQHDEIFGDFEDLENVATHCSIKEDENISDENNEDIKNEQQRGSTDDSQTRKEKRVVKLKEKRETKKKQLKALFDAEYDEGGEKKGTYFDEWKSEMEQQSQMNRQVFDSLDAETRIMYEGYSPGLYIRVQIDNIPCELIENFDPTYPVILGGLLNAEQNIGYVHVRIKKHRWHKHILKTRDPVIISLGWRRFQTVPMFSIQDHNGRHRLLKYTPEHLHCEATFWGPVTPQNTGMLTLQNSKTNISEFRITSTGSVIELDKSLIIVKKLKLTGTPYKIYRKTAFIQGMFSTNLEVAKFEGSSIRTVSGIRGQVKRAVKDGASGSFRATFEDKILLSDIVFMRTWYPVETTKFYNPVTTLLEQAEERKHWKGMKTVGQLRHEKGLKRKADEDHKFKSVIRRKMDFKPLLIPRDLQENLPFKDKPKMESKKKDYVQSKRVAVVRDAKERQVAHLMKMLKVLKEDKLKSRRKEMRERARTHQKDQAKITRLHNQKHKELKKRVFKMQGKMMKNKQRKT